MKTLSLLTCSASALTILLTAGCESTDNNPNIPPSGLTPPTLQNTPPVALTPTNDPEFNSGEISDNGGPGEFGLPGEEVATDPSDWTPIAEDLGFPIIYFAYDKDVIGANEQANLDIVANYMQENPELGLIIEGHCDDRGSAEYNRALGERRAIAIKDYLTANGVASTRFKTVSFGEENPAIDGQSLEAYSKNRRGILIPATMR